MVDRTEKTICPTKQYHLPELIFTEKNVCFEKTKTTVKVQDTLETTQKIHFVRPDFTAKARKIEEQGVSALLIKLMVDEISQGFVVITTKRADGKLHVIATKEIAQQLTNGSLTLQGKKGKVKDIAEVEVVLPEVFQELARTLSAAQDTALQDKKETKTEKGETVGKKSATTNVSFDPRPYSREFFDSLHMGIFSTWATSWATFCTDASEAVEKLAEEEMSHIQERQRIRQQQEREREAGDLRNQVKKYEIRRSEERLQVIKAQ